MIVGLALDRKLAFDHDLNEKILKANISIGLMNRLRKPLPRDSVLTIYKGFVRPHLNNGDIIYDYPGNFSACLATTGCFRESLADRRYSRKKSFFYKISNRLAP